MPSHVFVCADNLAREAFIYQFLEQEFTAQNLYKLILTATTNIKKNAKKEFLIKKTIALLENGSLLPHDILQMYVRTPRMWLSFQLGEHKQTPAKLKPDELLYSFGAEDWYGPIENLERNAIYYIRTFRFPEPLERDHEGIRTKYQYYRWPIIAEVRSNYVALSWYGFSYSNEIDKRANQFPFWTHIHQVFDELKDITKANWTEPDLYNLVLNKLWNKYLIDPVYKDSYQWKHLRIRAESSGVALNAKTSPGIVEIDVAGLQALSHRLATSALNAIDSDGNRNHDNSQQKLVESAILKTLIQDWGSKAYEFSLERFYGDEGESDKVFRAYCTFGLRKDLKTEDALQHLKCYAEYGNSLGALEFLLKEMGM